MKKKILFFLILICFMFPTRAKAISITNPSLTVSNVNPSVGDVITVKYRLEFPDISKDGIGVYSILANLDYDESALLLTTLDSNIANSLAGISKETKEVIFISEVSEYDDYINKCNDDYLFCGNEYWIEFTFFVRNTDKTSTNIKISNTTVFESDLNEEEKNTNEVLAPGGNITINIKNNGETVTNEPKSIVDNKTIDPTTPQNNITVSKSNNKFLKSLEIENYQINFDKYKYGYDITVEQEVNSLNVKVELQNPKATYKIIGADDLAKNDNKVSVEVTAENGDKNTYTIYVRKKGESLNNSNNDENNFQTAKLHIDEKYIKIASIIGGVILLIIIISFTVSKINNHKLNKLLKKM